MTSQAELLRYVPQARRYARALVGDQVEGDGLLLAALPGADGNVRTRLGLYAAITQRSLAHPRLQGGAPLGRQLLLLTAVEAFSLVEAAAIVGLTPEVATARLAQARAAVRTASVADVLIIEDEPIIALDLRMLVERCGHRVIGIAGSEVEAQQKEILKVVRRLSDEGTIVIGGGGDDSFV